MRDGEIITLSFVELPKLNDVRPLLGNLHMERFLGQKSNGICCEGYPGHSTALKLLGRCTSCLETKLLFLIVRVLRFSIFLNSSPFHSSIFSGNGNSKCIIST
ncbi:TMV resistance protein N [Trifolium repens]|nr:TMV resistance protein N [Trifolium repens]